MMNPEQAAWAQLRLAMDDYWVAQRHEDRFSVGIPDVSFVLPGGQGGWIELKAADPNGKVAIRRSQIVWMHRRVEFGAVCFIMIRGASGWVAIDFGAVGAGAIRSIKTFADAVRIGHFDGRPVEAFNLAWESRSVPVDTLHHAETQS